ncbi:MAG: proline--tRNA ligase [SAR86 cluster bacterium BACL1 MAG-120828-bin5]|jgi:prolyl-tRNA synthetase|uniref:Proline--tRNA ligase n=2 Tax=SAR86 cluster TaxID=62672 RepID=A0A0R2UAH6_9GAMM|nr:MAG: proline--tRNA ligase [SAR86 cluster bacterium BACL1 MAG-120507-bin14]KRO96487.1 MAG: proline--tRNA ligase [SAR86 cluster bacterium BACL1 MAG-120820-bin45]KRO96640.1 MAG: proline--tRNA ligase [SAR86 cluster bacterium BACL1 MAG-120828-bin5]KRO99398.1 MAG: proline--tRNA ligase [SAR86 cluster bacterium BACL1 MAG-120823-bin87]KRP01214.1 MAG: proline--tRNA ligase [SAR86 cluster bacterium BACL1 MAG-120619-bin26]KRP01431.1 MAG: proline--tRNA ligase [SAR86 cluster bacterium BACL1 MAG-120924-bin
MFWSKIFIPTLKDSPQDAEVISHQLMLRAGMIRKVASGIYTWLPLGLMVLRNIENIVREEMNASGAQEVLMPMVQPKELWEETKRWDKMGSELLRIKDRHDREFCLGPTHEEVITDLIRNNVKSYKELPLNIYQIQTKFRDEIRPRYGVMRGREFLMKDAYSFNLDEESLQDTYLTMRNTYKKILERIGLEYKIVQADSGAIGGEVSEEFHVLAENGEDTIAISDASEFAINTELLLKEGEDINSLEGQPSPDGNGKIVIKKGIEVGHIFQLGKVYTEAMQVNVQSQEGRAVDLFMGCYGIGVSRLVAAAIEQHHDDQGIIWPESIAPFEVNIVAIGYTKEIKIADAANELCATLKSIGYKVIVDDRKDGYGTKIKDAELIGIPINIIIGNKYLENGEIELKHRNGKSTVSQIAELSTIFDRFKK